MREQDLVGDLHAALTSLSPHKIVLASSVKANGPSVQLVCEVTIRTEGLGVPMYVVTVGIERKVETASLYTACKHFVDIDNSQ